MTSVTKVNRKVGLEKLKKEGDPEGTKSRSPEKKEVKQDASAKMEEGKAQSQAEWRGSESMVESSKRYKTPDKTNSAFIDYKEMRPTPILVTEGTVDYLNGIEEVEAEVKYMELDSHHLKEEGKPRTTEINTSNVLKHTASTQIF